MDKISRDAIPNDLENPFHSLARLLSSGEVSEAVLAASIEQEGIYTWDRFGRFRLVDKKVDEDHLDLREPLDLIAGQYAWREMEDDPSNDSESPLEKADGPYSRYDRFGWASAVLPDFTQIEKDMVSPPVAKHKGAETRKRGSLLLIIAGMAKMANVDIAGRGLASEVCKAVEMLGASISDNTVREILREIPEVIEKHQA